MSELMNKAKESFLNAVILSLFPIILCSSLASVFWIFFAFTLATADWSAKDGESVENSLLYWFVMHPGSMVYAGREYAVVTFMVSGMFWGAIVGLMLGILLWIAMEFVACPKRPEKRHGKGGKPFFEETKPTAPD